MASKKVAEKKTSSSMMNPALEVIIRNIHGEIHDALFSMQLLYHITHPMQKQKVTFRRADPRHKRDHGFGMRLSGRLLENSLLTRLAICFLSICTSVSI